MTDVDDYDDPVPAQEEPGCLLCGDAGCPNCGHLDPADPRHRAWIAEQIILARAANGPSLLHPATAYEVRAVVGELPEEADGNAVQALIASAHVQVTVTWPPTTGYSAEPPF